MVHIRCSVHTNILPGIYFECRVRAGERGQGVFNFFGTIAYLSLFENWRTLTILAKSSPANSISIEYT